LYAGDNIPRTRQHPLDVSSLFSVLGTQHFPPRLFNAALTYNSC
jgi:hypothetical protein